MAHPMIEWVLDRHFADLHGTHRQAERSVIVFGAMEATLTPLMESVEAPLRRHQGVQPAERGPSAVGRHIELGVKGPAHQADAAYRMLRDGLDAAGATCGPEMVR
jgi:molybdopterin-biosynthesis enzyme MoeA-like protein